MDTVNATDYIHLYPITNRILASRPRPPFGWQEGDIYRVLEDELGVRDSRIKELEGGLADKCALLDAIEKASNEKCPYSEYDSP